LNKTFQSIRSSSEQYRKLLSCLVPVETGIIKWQIVYEINQIKQYYSMIISFIISLLLVTLQIVWAGGQIPIIFLDCFYAYFFNTTIDKQI